VVIVRDILRVPELATVLLALALAGLSWDSASMVQKRGGDSSVTAIVFAGKTMILKSGAPGKPVARKLEQTSRIWLEAGGSEGAPPPRAWSSSAGSTGEEHREAQVRVANSTGRSPPVGA
jgi:hypothetical protein